MQQYLRCGILFASFVLASNHSLAKTSWYVGVNVPVVQQSSVTYHVQHIPSSAQPSHHVLQTQTQVGNPQQPRLLSNRHNLPKSVYYYPQTVHTAPAQVIYAPPVVYAPAPQVVYPPVVTQSYGNVPTQSTVYYHTQVQQPAQVSVVFSVGDVIPQHYRQMRYWVNDWQRYQLVSPPQQHVWLNVGGQFVLVNQPDYRVIRVQ